MNAKTASAVHAVIPLAILESMRAQDILIPDDQDEYHADFTTKRLGMSHTVSRQIDRYREAVARGRRVNRTEVVALLQLACRRNDAELLLTDAGRRAAALAADTVRRGVRRVWRALPRFVGRRFGAALAQRVLHGIFDVELVQDGRWLEARATEAAVVEATPNGGACKFYGSAVAATLRVFTDFDGALFHPSCRTSGSPVCVWNSGGSRED